MCKGNYGDRHDIVLCIKQTPLVGDQDDEPTCSTLRNWGGMEVISAGVKEAALQ
jgi:hypothetical protein